MALRPSRLVLLFCMITGFFVVRWYIQEEPTIVPGRTITALPEHFLQCPRIKGTSDVFITLRTGATELEAKLPKYLGTMLSCGSGYAIYSDHKETFRDENVQNVLASVSEEYRTKHADFDLYRRLEQSGRAGLKPEELAGDKGVPDPTNTGHRDNPGWKLDKWKFLPMLNATYTQAPDYKWYFFAEADSGVFKSNLLRYLKELDHTQPSYIGSETQIGSDLFAHGGSCFLVSNPALKRVVEEFSNNKAEWESLTDRHWAGDCVTGLAFHKIDIGLTFASQHFRGDHPGSFNYDAKDRHQKPFWCLPTMTWHHLSTEDVQGMAEFEEEWKKKLVASGEASDDSHLRYKDMFEGYIMPRMEKAKWGWDNVCKDSKPAQDQVGCAKACTDDPHCLQYQFDMDKKECKTSQEPRLGEAAPEKPSMFSHWMHDRVKAWSQGRPSCGNKAMWVKPN